MIATHYISLGPDTSYRVRPNPDGAAGDGSDGVVLEWSDDGGETWEGYFHIAGNQAEEVGRSILRLVLGPTEGE